MKLIFLCISMLCLFQCNQNHRNLIHLNSLLASHTSAKDDPKGAMKRPIKSVVLPDNANLTQFNKPVMVVEYEKNAEFLMKRDEVEMDDPCKIKQGYIGVVNRISKFDGKSSLFNSVPRPQTIYVRPVYAVLNKNTLSLFENEHLSALYSTINLATVTSCPQPPSFNVSGVYCFDVMRGNPLLLNNQKALKPDAPADVRASTICFTDALSMESWSQAILKLNSIKSGTTLARLSK